MPEIGTPGLMRGDGKRGVGHRPQATAPILDLYEAAVVKGISVVFSDLDSLWLRMVRHIRNIILVIANTSCSIAPAFV